MKRLVVLFCAVLAGCGGEDGGPSSPGAAGTGGGGTTGAAGSGGSGGGGVIRDQLAGTDWGITWTEVVCATVTGFGYEQDYYIGFGCTLTDGSTGIQMEAGTYNISGNTLTTVPDRATCPGVGPSAVTFSVNQSNLVIQTPTEVIIFERVAPGGSGGGAATYGCFDDQLVFTPMPIRPV